MRRWSPLVLVCAIALHCGAAIVPDSDGDGLEDSLEATLGTDPHRADTDGDGLSDYDEYCKYHTDPTKKYSDGDGLPDGDWSERREFTYTIRAVCEIRPPNNVDCMTDLYQDARRLDRPAAHSKDGTVIEVILYPYSEPHLVGQPFPLAKIPDELAIDVQQTLGMNYSPQMRDEVLKIVGAASTDMEATQAILNWIAGSTRLVNTIPEFGYFCVTDNRIEWTGTLRSDEANRALLDTNFFGDSMFKRRVHGTCSSLAMLRGTMLRAAGLPTRLIQTLPMVNRYENDYEPLADRMRKRIFARGYEWGEQGGGANHMYNEVFLNHHWIRVDSIINTGPFVGDKLFLRAWSASDVNNLFPRRKPEEAWNQDRDLRTLDLSDELPKHASALDHPSVDLAVGPDDLAVTRVDGGRLSVSVVIHNTGNAPSPEAQVRFYGVNKSREKHQIGGDHGAGPVMPHATWNEGAEPFTPAADDVAIAVSVDPDDQIHERDESNNSAQREIPEKSAR